MLDDAEDPTVKASSSASVSKRDNQRKVTCGFPGCDREFKASDIRQHTGWHLQFSREGAAELPCGMCGVMTQCGFVGNNASAPPNCCPAWLEKGTGKSKKPVTLCRIVGQVNYSHGAALKSTDTSPCTNVLLQCPACPTKPMASFFWKYDGMSAHWRTAHPTKTMPGELVDALKVSDAALPAVSEPSTAMRIDRWSP